MARIGFLERQFRAQFAPHDGGYRFRHEAADYWFDSGEVAQFVAEWRLYWANPLVWGGYALVGVAMPIWAYSHDLPELAAILAVVATIAMVTTLHFPWRQPREVALGRVPIDEQQSDSPPSVRGLIFLLAIWAGILAYWLFYSAGAAPSSQMFALFWTALITQQTGFYLWRWIDFQRGGSGSPLAPITRAFDLLSPLVAALVTAVVLCVSPDTNWSERWFVMGLFAIFGGVTIDRWLNPPVEGA